jgi:hypothetical protein
MNGNWIDKIPREKGYYLAGFADGEASFNVSLRKRDDQTMRLQVVLSFNIYQNESYILSQYKRYFGCGKIRKRPDGVYYYTITNTTSIIEKVIPFFKKFRLLSQKKKINFTIFSEIAVLVAHKKHLEEKGLEKIISLRELLNEGRGRKIKYSIEDLGTFNRKNPQRLYAKPRIFREEK